MKLTLFIYPKNNLSKDPVPVSVLPGVHYRFDCMQMVSAKLEEYSADYEYLLQAGADSDHKFRLCRGDRRGEFSTLKGDKISRFFENAWGDASIYLLQLRCDGVGRKSVEKIILNNEVWVRPSPQKRHYYDSMLYDMRLVPSFFLDDFRGQMRLNGFSFDWEAGTTDAYDFEFELSETKGVLSRLVPLYEKVFSMPMARIVRKKKKLAVGRVRGATPSDYHRLCRSVTKTILSTNPRTRVVVSRRERTDDISAHRVMLTFLVALRDRMREVERLLSAREDELDRGSVVDGFVYASNVRDRAFLGKEYERVMERTGLKRCREEKELIDLALERLLRNDFWREVRVGMRAKDVYPAEFNASRGYVKIYAEILAYEKKLFSLRAQCQGRDLVCKISKISSAIQAGEESRLQRKYSIVYEYWTYYRMHKAFLANGFSIVSNAAHHIDSGSSCVYEKGDLRVSLIHGVTARLKQFRQTGDGFWLEYIRDEEKERSPDFVLIFTNIRNKRQRWIVLDAKSDNVMRYHIVKRRQKYLKKVKRYKVDGYDCPERPSQSWMIYSGENEEGGVCRVECPPRYSANLNPEMNEVDYDAESTSYALSDKGLTLSGSSNALEIYGNVHANIGGIGTTNSPFDNFVNWETKAMSKELGARLIY